VEWKVYFGILQRRWPVVLAILLLNTALSGYLFRKSTHAAGYQSCLTLYVADVSSPSLIAAAGTNLQTTAQLLAGETAANFFADDLLDIAQSRSVSRYVAAEIGPKRLPSSAFADINGSVSGSRLDRTVNLCVTNPDAGTAQVVAGALGIAMTSARAQFIGPSMARRTFVREISDPTVGAAPTSSGRLTLALRLLLGLFAALGLALLWDAVDPNVRDAADAETALGAPVLAMLP
jgi:capsular polysaccharide biosynthesis protein